MKKPAKPRKKRSVKTSELVAQPHGGALQVGNPGNAGGGRPPDAIRAAMRELGAAKGVPFLSDVLDGNIHFTLIGTCPHCKEESRADTVDLDALAKLIGTSIDHRLKANEQVMKYGLGTKDEVTLVSPEITARIARQVDLINSRPTWTREELLAALDPIWQ